MRRALTLVAAAFLAVAALGMPAVAEAQPAGQAAPAMTGEVFVRSAHSSATLQARAAELAASRETRPEVRAFAGRMVAFRRDQLPKLEAAARENKLTPPDAKQFEHQVQIENLEPLDFLALSRRYAELQVQALEQEVQIYRAAANSPDAWVKSFAAGVSSQLTKLLEEARAVHQTVAP